GADRTARWSAEDVARRMDFSLRSAYAHAIENRYRFYSYGDASLLYRAETSDGR
ncbi:MAG: hypothetical protein E5V77_04540, partial [Mesorhizobium sp.]